MSKFVFWIIVFFLFLFIFFKSNTWEVTNTVEERFIMEGHSIEYNVAKHSLHWDRFLDYIKNIPSEIKSFILQKWQKWVQN